MKCRTKVGVATGGSGGSTWVHTHTAAETPTVSGVVLSAAYVRTYVRVCGCTVYIRTYVCPNRTSRRDYCIVSPLAVLRGGGARGNL